MKTKKTKSKVSELDLLIEKALNFAVIQHYEQYRKGTGIPYVAHVLDVLKQLALWGIVKSEENADIWATALIHDTYEDGDTTLELIESLFNKRIAGWVDALSFRSRNEGESSQDYQAAKSAHFEKLESADLEVIVIKLADRLCNVRDFMADIKTLDYAAQYYQKGKAILAAFKKRRKDIFEKFGDEIVFFIICSIHDLESRLGIHLYDSIQV